LLGKGFGTIYQRACISGIHRLDQASFLLRRQLRRDHLQDAFEHRHLLLLRKLSHFIEDFIVGHGDQPYQVTAMARCSGVTAVNFGKVARMVGA
jgi:hypothetical protein